MSTSKAINDEPAILQGQPTAQKSEEAVRPQPAPDPQREARKDVQPVSAGNNQGSVIQSEGRVDNADNAKVEEGTEESKEVRAGTGQNPSASPQRSSGRTRARPKKHVDNIYAEEDEGEEESQAGKKGRKDISSTRRLWTKEEDEAITQLVKHYGIRKWTLISKKLQERYGIHGRSGKQCRERYFFIVHRLIGGTIIWTRRSRRSRSRARRKRSYSTRRKHWETSGRI